MASCDKLPAADGSVDLLNVSEAVHWFIPIENFYKEVDRVLKPGGCLAVYEYGHAEYTNHLHVQELNDLNNEVMSVFSSHNNLFLKGTFIFLLSLSVVNIML